MKKFISRFFLALGIIFMVGIMFSQEFRRELANAISPILDPLSQAFPFHIVILILATFTAFYSSIIQRYTVDFKRMKEIQKKVMEFQKEYMEAMKQKNQYKLKQMESKKDEMQKMQSEMMSMQFKPMFYIGVVTIPIFMWLWLKVKNSVMEVIVPFAGKIHVADPVLIVPWWLFWYILCSITITQIIKKVFRIGV
ncbi:MAG: DUF106 domain-containing protein [Archaeoglobaceae archaeon]|nr:DUF106 domain-containing protein [Archaeoglobaceae archaeon]HDD36302.1 DUF106 domain-containing protein [Archaeoglobus veneficus]